MYITILKLSTKYFDLHLPVHHIITKMVTLHQFFIQKKRTFHNYVT